MIVKEVVLLEEIVFDYEFNREIGISLGNYLEEIVRGILLT